MITRHDDAPRTRRDFDLYEIERSVTAHTESLGMALIKGFFGVLMILASGPVIKLERWMGK